MLGDEHIYDKHTFTSNCRLVDGVEVLSRIMHPTVVTLRCPERMVMKLGLSGGQRCRQGALSSHFHEYT